MSRIIALSILVVTLPIQASPPLERLYGTWTCTQNYDVAEGLALTSEYTVHYERNVATLDQSGWLKLTAKNAPNKVFSLTFNARVSFQFDGNSATYQPLNINAQAQENTLGLPAVDFIENFENQRELSHSTLEFLSDNEVRTVYNSGNTANCHKSES